MQRKKVKISKKFVTGLLGGIAAGLFIAGAQAAPITTPVGLNSGEQYRLVFVTSTTTNALSSDINYYNNFVNDLANLNPVLASLGTTWTAIASTETVNARANTATHPVANGAGAPIYLLDGSTKIADSNADLWSGTLDAPIDLYEDGTSPISAFLTVWTGTIQKGLSFPDRRLGETAIAYAGRTDQTGGGWIRNSVNALGQEHSLYAISGILTVTAIPEPGILAVFCVGLTGLIVVRRKRAA